MLLPLLRVPRAREIGVKDMSIDSGCDAGASNADAEEGAGNPMVGESDEYKHIWASG